MKYEVLWLLPMAATWFHGWMIGKGDYSPLELFVITTAVIFINLLDFKKTEDRG